MRMRAAVILLAIVSLAFGVPALAGVPKVVILEDFTATWCTYCPAAACALTQLNSEYPNTTIITGHHVTSNDPWIIPETNARFAWYGDSNDGIPDVRIAGKYRVLGAGSCASAYAQYLAKYNQSQAETGGVSPVSINGYFSAPFAPGAGTLHATITLLDPAALGSLQATLIISEDEMDYQGTVYEHVTRVVTSQPVSLVNVGDAVTLDIPYTIGATWNLANLKGVAVLQQTTASKGVVQAARLDMIGDFALTIGNRIASVREGNGDALLHFTVKNSSLTPDVYHLAVDQAAGWPTSFQVENGPWQASADLPLNPQEVASVTVRAQTDGVTRIGTGHFTTQSTNSGRLQSTPLDVFNGSPSILLVDDDGTEAREVTYDNGLDQVGWLHQDWHVTADHAGNSPDLTDLLGYDVVIWETGIRTAGQVLDASEQSRLGSYLNAGGRLYLNSPGFLINVPPPNGFVVNYLGVASRTNFTVGNTAVGVAGDPIGNGLNLPLTFVPGENQIATVNPTASASVVFRTESGNPAVLRNVNGNAKTVFSTILQEAYPQNGADPNNSRVVIERTVSWLLGPPSDPASVPDGVVAASRLTVSPNPVHAGAEIGFRLTARDAAAPVRLVLVDVTGREVRSLLSGRLDAGDRSVRWDGADANGRAVPSGVYFAKLASAEGVSTQRIVLAR